MRNTVLKPTFTLLVVLTGVLFILPADEPSRLDQVLQTNQLVVISRNAASTYYQDGEDPAGLEFDLVNMFAERLGVEVKFIVANDLEEIFTSLAEGKAHFAAAGLTQTPDRHKRLRFTPPYQYVTQQLIYRQGSPRPRSIDDLQRGRLVVVAGSSHLERLRELRERHPGLSWETSSRFTSDDLLRMVESREIDFTIADSNELALSRYFYPHLRVAFDISEKQPVAWAFPIGDDDTLYREAVNFFVEIHNNGILEQILERYYGHIQEFDYVATTTFRQHIRQRLPKYRELFLSAGRHHRVDWRLLAAMAYQESHWNPRAVSPTGVRGIMMLTQITARRLGIKKRTDPAQSIEGGARYLRMLMDRLPQEITEPDRSWLALAAYNIGYGHLMDGREITRQTGGNPNLWMDVKKKLPLLRDKEWYRKTRYGFARGDEAVQYVENIRSYYRFLLREMPATVEMAREG